MTKIYAPIAWFQGTIVNFVEANIFVGFKDAGDVIITYYITQKFIQLMGKTLLLILHLKDLEIEIKDLVKDLEQDNLPEIMKPIEDQDKILTNDMIHSRTRN